MTENVRDLVVVGEGSGSDLVGLYLLTPAQSETAWNGHPDLWDYLMQGTIPYYETFTELSQALTENGWVINQTWVTPCY